MDPLAVVCTNPHQSIWLARADIFKSKATQPILKFLKLLPVYRIRDGKDNLSNNEQIFAQVIDLLENKQTVALFPEAAHSGRRQMLPHKKAIPRIALEAEEKNNFRLDLQIVPVGIYYDHYWAFNRSLIVQYGKPIEVNKYRQEYAESPQKAMLGLREEILELLLPLTMQIGSNTHYATYENMRSLPGKKFATAAFNGRQRLMQQFLYENESIKKLEALESNDPETFGTLLEATGNYYQNLATQKLCDEQVFQAIQTNGFIFMIRLVAGIMFLPLLMAGLITNALPFFIPRLIIRKKVKNLTFLSTFNFVAGLLVFPLFYLLVAGLIRIFSHSLLPAIGSLILMPFIGKLSYQLLIFYRHIFDELKLRFGKQSFRNNIKQLAKQRETLVSLIVEKTRNF